MRIEIISQGIDESARFRKHVETRLRTALHSFAHRVEDVRASLRDINGPKGGVDTELHVEARLRGASTVRIRELALTPREAVGRGSERIRRAVRRSLSRSQSRRRAGTGREVAA